MAAGSPIFLAANAQTLANYPHARVLPNGMIFVSGVSARRLDNSISGVEISSDGGTVLLSIKEQTKAVLDNISNILAAAGSSLSDLVDVTIFLKSMKDYSEFNEVYNSFFLDKLNGPSRTTVEISALPGPHLLIEIKAIAIKQT